jgi:hypothetical protein
MPGCEIVQGVPVTSARALLPDIIVRPLPLPLASLILPVAMEAMIANLRAGIDQRATLIRFGSQLLVHLVGEAGMH